MGSLALILAVLAIAAGVAAGFASRRHPLVLTGLVLNGLAMVSVATLWVMRRSGASPVGQLNSADGRDWWSVWFHLWPVFALGLLVCFQIALVVLFATIVVLVRTRRHAEGTPTPRLLLERRGPVRVAAVAMLAHATLTLAQVGAALWWVGSNFPDA